MTSSYDQWDTSFSLLLTISRVNITNLANNNFFYIHNGKVFYYILVFLVVACFAKISETGKCNTQFKLVGVDTLYF